MEVEFADMEGFIVGKAIGRCSQRSEFRHDDLERRNETHITEDTLHGSPFLSLPRGVYSGSCY